MTRELRVYPVPPSDGNPYAAGSFGRPTDLFPHDNPFPDLGREARRILIRHCDHITVHCSRARDLLEAEFGPLPRISVLPQPNYAEYPSPPDRQAARVDLQIPSDAFLFLMFGSLRDYKGIDRAIAAFPRD